MTQGGEAVRAGELQQNVEEAVQSTPVMIFTRTFTPPASGAYVIGGSTSW